MVLNTINRYPTSTWVFCAMWVLIGFVSSYDVYLSVLNGDYLYELEKNPMARYVIAKCGVPAFVGIKMFGTIFALGCITVLYHNYRKISWIINTSIFLGQMLLFAYLTYFVV